MSRDEVRTGAGMACRTMKPQDSWVFPKVIPIVSGNQANFSEEKLARSLVMAMLFRTFRRRRRRLKREMRRGKCNFRQCAGRPSRSGYRKTVRVEAVAETRTFSV